MSKSCYIYCRCAGNNKFAGLASENQKESMIRYAKDHDLSITAIGTALEPGLSANRNSILDMIACVREQNIAVVLVSKLDRLSRKTDEFYEIAIELRKAGAKIISLSEGEFILPTCAAVYCRFATQTQMMEGSV